MSVQLTEMTVQQTLSVLTHLEALNVAVGQGTRIFLVFAEVTCKMTYVHAHISAHVTCDFQILMNVP